MKISFLVFQLALFILVAGILCIYINYDCDRQRQEFRRTNGKSLVWGKAPSKVKMHRIYWITIFHLECTFYILFGMYWITILLSQDLHKLFIMKIYLQIEASYTTASGETKRSLLLTSGWYVFP